MKIELPDHYVEAVIRALEHKDAAAKALKHEDPIYLAAAEYFRHPEKRDVASEQAGLRNKRKRA